MLSCSKFEPDKGSDLCNQNGGHTDHKVPVLRFVPENLHPKDRADASARSGGEKQNVLRNAAGILMFRQVLVPLHHNEGCEVNKQEIGEENNLIRCHIS